MKTTNWPNGQKEKPMLPKDTLALIQETAIKADGPDIVTVDREPRHVYFVRDRTTGSLDRREADAPPRAHRLFTIQAFIDSVLEFQHEKTAVFAGRENVTAVFDMAGTRRDTVSMQLPLSSEFHKLKALASNRSAMSQKAFLNMLRIDLAGGVSTDEIGTFRSIKFSKSEDGESNVSTSREAIGMKVKKEIAAAGKDIPEEISVGLYVYRDLANPENEKSVRCAVDVNLDDATFTLVPLSGELERVHRETDEWIVEHLRASLTGVEIFCGSPQ